MTRILKRGQKTYFKEDVVACLADETMQKTFTQSEYGNRIVFMDELQEEAKERFNMDFTDEDYKNFKTLIAKDEYLLSLDDNAGILESKALDIVVGYGRVKGGVSGLWENEQAKYDQKEQIYNELLKEHPMKYDAKAECVWLPDGTKVSNVLSTLQAEYYHDNYLYHEVFERVAQMEFENNLKNEVLNQSNEFKSQKLSKLQCDCLEFLGCGNCCETGLLSNNLDNHIQAMKIIYESFDEQDTPVWINNEMIDLYKDQMWTASLSKQANSLCDRLMECFEDMDPYEAMDCSDIDIDTQKHNVYEALVTGDTDNIITDLEDYKCACAGGDLEQYDKIQKLLDDVLQFEKNVNSNYVKRFDPHYAMSISAVRDLLKKGTVIQCNHMRDPSYPVPDGTRGVVEKVDDDGLVHVKWENGSGLNLDPLVDDFEVIEDELDLGENQQEDEMEL